MKLDDYFVVLWSQSQTCFHVETVGEMLTRNYQVLEMQSFTDYIVLCFAQSQKEANDAAEKLKKDLNLEHASELKSVIRHQPAKRLATPKCPECGKSMVQRTARQGRKAGSIFWGCQSFPSCTGRLPI